jgi:hypothetical protein
MKSWIASVLLFALPVFAQGGGGSDPVGSLPRQTLAEKDPCKGTTIVKPGGSALNNDGMMVTSSANSAGSCSLTPGKDQGSANCSSKANAKAGWDGSINGQDSNDSTSISGPTLPNTLPSVTGTGGTVSIGPGCNVHVVNSGGPGSGSMSVNTPTGTTVLAPGQGQIFHT